MRLITAPVLALLLLGPCLAAEPTAPPAAAASAASAPFARPDAQSRAIYQLQHRLVPGWAHKSQGAFYADLRDGRLERLRQTATELVSAEYAAGIKVTPYPELNGVLIEYPMPQVAPHCYFSFVRAKGDGEYEVHTYEKTMTLPGLDNGYGVLGGWTADGTHFNKGSRTYQQAADFVRDLKLPQAH